MAKRFKTVEWGDRGIRKRTSDAKWREPLNWNSQLQRGMVHRCNECDTRFVAKKAYCKKCATSNVTKVKRERVFCASLSDLFENNASQKSELTRWRSDALYMMANTPYIDWLVLTKRPENVYTMIEQSDMGSFSDAEMWLYANPHISFGTSIENQFAANTRMPHLLNIPAKTRFLSVEPLLGEISLRHWANNMPEWVIIGGESGNKARPLHVEWIEKLVAECIEFNVPYFVKQFGDNPFRNGESFKAGYKGHDMNLWPEKLRVRQYPD